MCLKYILEDGAACKMLLIINLHMPFPKWDMTKSMLGVYQGRQLKTPNY